MHVAARQIGTYVWRASPRSYSDATAATIDVRQLAVYTWDPGTTLIPPNSLPSAM
jgi:hypothetical protein